MEEDHFKKAGKKGGDTTLLRYGVEQLKKWGSKGGRPKKIKDMSHSGSFVTQK